MRGSRSVPVNWETSPDTGLKQCGNAAMKSGSCYTMAVRSHVWEMRLFGYANVFTSHVNVGFFHGAGLRDPARLLEGAGKRMRHVKLRPGAARNAAALSELIDAAYWDI